ncbi:Vacuolar protein sorting-associated protein 26B [Termitomyces sp. J132]|nr:Vacuolar protein sorting-associated protein 26B [Termitomyces sp. J132]
MDGAPVRGELSTLDRPSSTKAINQLSGETIPIHLLLGGNDLTPTFRDVNKFSTRCYLNLVLIDKENRRYFKQQVRHLSALPRHEFNKTLRFLSQIKSFSSGSRLRKPLRSKSIYALR